MFNGGNGVEAFLFVVLNVVDGALGEEFVANGRLEGLEEFECVRFGGAFCGISNGADSPRTNRCSSILNVS